MGGGRLRQAGRRQDTLASRRRRRRHFRQRVDARQVEIASTFFFVITDLWQNKLERFVSSNIFFRMVYLLVRLSPIQGPLL